MTTLICFGFGYSAEHFIGMFGDGFDRIIGTVRGAERAAVLSAPSCRPAEGAGLRRRFGDPGSEKRDRGSGPGACFSTAE